MRQVGEDREDREDRGGLLAGIREDAAREGQRLLQEAQEASEQRRRAAERQAESIRQEVEERIARQSEALRRQGQSALRMEEKRLQMRVREGVIARVEQAVRRRLEDMIGQESYRQVLLDWIVEAAVGLNAAQASVNTSAAERAQVDDRLLREAEKRVRRLTGATLQLTRAEGNPLVGQGVVLAAADGRVEYNNQVSTRLLRRQAEIRKLIQEELFG